MTRASGAKLSHPPPSSSTVLKSIWWLVRHYWKAMPPLPVVEKPSSGWAPIWGVTLRDRGRPCARLATAAVH